MRTPIIPSFFKTSKAKSFSFKPRYYNEQKERIEALMKGEEKNIRFKISRTKKEEKGRGIKIILLIIILSLLAYTFIIN
ncbi:MAG: hypothetical protein CMD16_04145 [Flavobacteriales bacterium]|nr:hypothetical protein [Flavobacteriales bacterium]|tara:strand:+ start:25658 stop:25894 length:237 start_codon:yes stop_codon:yes gene_type:complete